MMFVAVRTIGCPLGPSHVGLGMKALPILSIHFRMANSTLHMIFDLLSPGSVSIIGDLSVTIRARKFPVDRCLEICFRDIEGLFFPSCALFRQGLILVTVEAERIVCSANPTGQDQQEDEEDCHSKGSPNSTSHAETLPGTRVGKKPLPADFSFSTYSKAHSTAEFSSSRFTGFMAG
jgi:hypothetical protein